MKEKQKGGSRKGAGRKPSPNKKEPITVFVETKTVQSFGGRESIRLAIYGFLGCGQLPELTPAFKKEAKIAKGKGLTKPVVAPKLQDSPEPEYTTQTLDLLNAALESLPVHQIDDMVIEKQIAEIKAEKIPKERDTVFGRKSWEMDRQKRIQELKNQLK